MTIPGVTKPGEYVIAYSGMTGSATLVKGKINLEYKFPPAFYGLFIPPPPPDLGEIAQAGFGIAVQTLFNSKFKIINKITQVLQGLEATQETIDRINSYVQQADTLAQLAAFLSQAPDIDPDILTAVVDILGPFSAFGQLLNPASFFSIPAFKISYDISSVDIVQVPSVGLPVVTTANVQLNPDGVATFETTLYQGGATTADLSAPPVLQQAQLRFENNQPLVVLRGSNFIVPSTTGNNSNASFNDLVVNFLVGDENYQGTILSGTSLGNNSFEVKVRPSNKIALGTAKIVLTRLQLERFGTEVTDIQTVNYDSNSIRLSASNGYILATQPLDDRVVAIKGTNPEAVVEATSSRDLLVARIPVGTEGEIDSPRDIAFTPDGDRAYVTLERSGRIALVDPLILQQVDTNRETEAIDLIDLPTGAQPYSITIDQQSQYAYVTDRRLGVIYVLDINPHSQTYNQLIQNIQVDFAPQGLRGLAISSDGRKLFATAPNFGWGDSKVIVINIDPQDKPNNKSQNSRRWHQQIGAIDTHRGAEGISASSDPLKMTFTNRKSDATGFGVLEITNADPLSFAATARYTDLTLGNINDYFDVNEGVAVVTTLDRKYGFVTGFNGSFFGSKVESIDGVQAGSNIGIIKNPLGRNPQLVAATRPIPMGLTTDLVLSNDDKYLYATYSLGGGVYVFDVEEIIQTLEHPGNYIIDQFGRNSSSSFFDPAYQRSANMFDFAGVPIDDINPNISIAADYGIISEDRARNQFRYGVFEDSNRAPIGAGITRNLAVSPPDLVNLLAPYTPQSDLTPTFTWDFLVPDEQIKEVNLFVSTFGEDEGLLPWDRVVDLSDQSLLPSLSLQQKRELLSDPWHGYDDFNPGRILTATWKRDTNTWYWHDGTTPIAQAVGEAANTSTSFTLPGERTLTAGQHYHWGVQAISDTGKSTTETGEFQAVATHTTSPFSSVTVLTHGFTPPLIQPLSVDRYGVPVDFYQIADKITHAFGDRPEDMGLIMRYDHNTGYWIPVDKNGNKIEALTGGLETTNSNYWSTLINNLRNQYLNTNKPLVLLPTWNTEDSNSLIGNESAIPDSGFTEAAADTIFASIVQLDQALGGDVGEHDSAGNLVKLYNNEGKLVRTQGDIFNSPLHFMGFSRGTVVNSEIIQRLGTYFPHAGGVERDLDGKIVRGRGDLQMTTIDPHDFAQPSLLFFSDLYEPKVQVWDNITFADNYYQTAANPNGFTLTPNGRDLPNLPDAEKQKNPQPPGLQFPTKNGRILGQTDYTLSLNNRTGFTEDDGVGGPHARAMAWYAGTVNLDNLDLFQIDGRYTNTPTSPPELSNPIYDQLGEADVEELLDGNTPSSLTSWYSNEGRGEGWYYSVLGGGKQQRNYADINTRVSVTFDNTLEARMRGDFAVPTLFNGNFDAVTKPKDASRNFISDAIPGWSFHNGSDSGSTTHLFDWIDIPNFGDYRTKIGYDPDQPNYALRLENNQSITHNRFVVPDWGNLRFDVYAPIINGKLKVLLESQGYSKSLTIDLDTDAVNRLILQPPTPNNTVYDQITQLYTQTENQIGYGRKGFETFQLKLNDEDVAKLRGQVATVTFLLENGSSVYLDNIFFKSDHLSLGNITEARWDTDVNGQYRNNLLLEKPQYVVSYNEDRRTPNWSVWKVDSTWVQPGSSRLNDVSFIADPNLPNGWFSYDGGVFNGVKMDRGHLTPDRDRNRNLKDQLSTYLTTNIIAQALDNNRILVDPRRDYNGSTDQASAWYNLEQAVFDRVTKGEKQYYILDGAFGHNDKPQKATNVPYLLNDKLNGEYINQGDTRPNRLTGFGNNIHISTWTWKVVVPVDNNDTPTDAIAYLTPNEAEPVSDWNQVPTEGVVHPFSRLGISRPNVETALDWRKTSTWRIDLSELQNILNQQSDLPTFNFNTRYDLLGLGTFTPNNNPNNSAPLLADSSEGNGIVGVREWTINSRSENSFTIKSVSVNNYPARSAINFRSNVSTTAPSDFSQITSFKDKFIKISANDLTVFPVTINEVGSEITSFHDGILQITPDHFWYTAKPPFTTGKVAVNKAAVTNTVINPNGFKGNTVENSSSKINSFQFNPIQTNVLQNNTSKIPLPSLVSSQQLLSSHVLHPNITHLTNIYSTAQSLWKSANSFDLTFQIADLPSGQLAEAQITKYDSFGQPIGGNILIDSDANGKGWFIDSTPLDNSEFNTTLTDTAFRATTGDAVGKYDLLTTILHEMGHLAGFISGYSGFDRYVQTVNASKVFVGHNFTATLTPDGSHLDSKIYAYDLMNTTLSPGVRKLPSLVDIQILNAVYNSSATNSSIAALTAPLTSAPLVAILNGTFDENNTTDPDYGWSTRGGSAIINGQAILSEDDRFNTNFSQSIVIPSGAKYLQFTLLDTQLGASTKFNPADAFEVALLDANTFAPLAGTATGLTSTDALLNIQSDGTAYLSPFVKLKGSAIANNTLTLDSPLTFTVDVSNIAPGTQAKLYFDLLGFGEVNAQVILDNVRLLTKDVVAPTASDDTFIAQEATPVTLNILSNDSDLDGTIDPTTLTISTNPNNGAVIVNRDGTIIYTPNSSFIGTDSITYTVGDDDGETSNPATVTITVNNVLPTINNVLVEAGIIEGNTATFTAIATDPGSNDLTYTWNFGDGTSPIIGRSVNHIYADNGDYTALLTVTDTNGGATTQTLTVNVANAAPIVTAGNDQTIDEGQSVTFNGNFTDAGILDTHTITWDFGDGVTASGILNPTHTYAVNGVYAVTLSVTDNDGSQSSDTYKVTVNNVAPTITNITAQNHIQEGENAIFSATATDPGNDTLTYTWNFGDGSNALVGQSVNHVYANNGTYNVILSVNDSDRAITSTNFSVNVSNVAPVVVSGVDQTVNQGQIIALNGQFTDPGILDTHTISWDFGDGTTATNILNPTHIYSDNGIYNVTLSVTDDNGSQSSDTLAVTVNNVAPTITKLESDSTINEGIAAQFSAIATDPGLDSLTYTWNFGDGSNPVSGSTVTHVYANNGTYTTLLSVTDFDGGVTSDQLVITVNNLAPTITNVTWDHNINEGDTAHFSAEANDPGNDTLTYTWNFGDGSEPVTGKSVNHIYTDNGDYNTTLTVTDADGATTSSMITLTVNNVAPSVNAPDDSLIYAGEDITFNGSFTDPGIKDTHTIVWDFGDGTTITGSLQPTHIYAVDGNYTVTLTVTDNNGEASSDTTAVTVKKLPTLSINDVTLVEGNDGTKLAVFTASLSQASTRTITVNYSTADHTAIAGVDYTANTGILTIAPGTTTTTIAVPIIGEVLDEWDETFTLNLTNANNATITKAQGIDTISDDDEPPTIVISDRTITEGDDGTINAIFTVSLSAPSAKTITVNYSTADNTAIAGADYTANTGKLTFAPGSTSQIITVAVIGDRIDEVDETFTVNLTNANNATIADNQAVGTISDDDELPTIIISDKTIVEGDDGTVLAVFTVSLSAPSGKTVTVDYATIDGTAIALRDYTATSGKLTFAPGTTTQTITVAVLGDRIDEVDETFKVNLSNATNANITKAQGIGTIVDNDALPALTIAECDLKWSVD